MAVRPGAANVATSCSRRGVESRHHSGCNSRDSRYLRTWASAAASTHATEALPTQARVDQDDGEAIRRASGASASSSSASSSTHSNRHVSRPSMRPRVSLEDFKGWTAPKVDAPAWTSLIANCETPGELQKCLAALRSLSNPFHLTAVLDKLATFAHSNSPTCSAMVPGVVARAREALPRLQARSLSSVARCLGAYEYRDKELMADLAKHAETHIHDFTTQGLANMLWGFARCGIPPPQRWMDSYLGAVQGKLQRFKPQELSILMWSLAKLQFRMTPARIDELLQHVTSNLADYGRCPQGLSNLLWALGVMQHRPPTQWMDTVVGEMQTGPKGLERFTNQGLSQALWALAILRYQPSTAFGALAAKSIVRRLPTCNTLDLATFLYVCAGLQLPITPDRATQLTAQVMRHYTAMSPGHIAKCVWAFAKLDLPITAAWLRKTLSLAAVQLDAFNVHDLSMFAWGLAKLNIEPPHIFLRMFVQRIEQVAASFAPNEVANTMWALARFGVRPSPLLVAQFFEATDRRLSTFKPAELSQMIWALADRRCVLERPWVQEYVKVSFLRLPEFNGQGLSNVAWAFSRLGVSPPPAWMYKFVQAAQALQESGQLSALDLGTLVNSLTILNKNMQLSKVSDFVMDAMDALSAMEVDRQAYTLQQVQYLQGMRWSAEQAAAAHRENGLAMQASAPVAEGAGASGEHSSQDEEQKHKQQEREQRQGKQEEERQEQQQEPAPKQALADAAASNDASVGLASVRREVQPEMDVNALRAYLEAQVQADVLGPQHAKHDRGRDAAQHRREMTAVGGSAAAVHVGRVLKGVKQRQRQRQQQQQQEGGGLAVQQQQGGGLVVQQQQGTLTVQVPSEMQIEMPDLHVELMARPSGMLVQGGSSSSNSNGGGGSGNGEGGAATAGAAAVGSDAAAAAVAAAAS